MKTLWCDNLKPFCQYFGWHYFVWNTLQSSIRYFFKWILHFWTLEQKQQVWVIYSLRMKIFAKITSRQMGFWSRTFLTYHDFCTGLRERSVLNYFAGCLPWQQRVSGTFIVLQKFAAVIMIVHWQTALSTLDNKSWKCFKKPFLCV